MDWIGISVIVGLLAIVIIQYTQLDLLGRIERYTKQTAESTTRMRIAAEQRPKTDGERIAEMLRKYNPPPPCDEEKG